MENKNIYKLLQNDIKKSTPIIINNNDNFSNIKKNLGSKYTEDISDSDDDLSSYKKRNSTIINQMIVQKPIKKNSKVIEDEINDLENDLIKNTLDDDDENNEDNSNKEEIEYEYTDEFKEKVKTYVKNDDKIRELQIELKKLNSEKKIAEGEILKHLERLGETNINITGGKLRINQYESKDGLKEDIIKEAIGEKIKDPKIIETIFKKINEKRVEKSKIQVSLKRTFERNTKK